MGRNTKGAYAKYHKETAKHYVDYDYLNDLSESELEFLAQFSDEYYGARFARETSLHSKEQRRELYSANNHRNRDVMSKRKLSVDTYEFLTDEVLMSKV